MAGSYGHVTNDRGVFVGVDLLENDGDVFEACEEMYGMIWYLANGDRKKVAEAVKHYTDGINLSPSVKV